MLRLLATGCHCWSSRGQQVSQSIFRKSTSLLCLRRSFHFSTSKIPYGWQRKAYILDLASISRYSFASMDFRISFSRNEWLSFSEQWSTHGTHGLSPRSSFFSGIPWIIVEKYMLYLMLFVILRTFSFSSCFLLRLPFGQWFVVRLQSCFWFPSLLIAPLVFLSCSPCPTFFIWGYVSSLVRDSWLENERNASQLFVKKSYSPFYLKGLNLDYSWYGFKTCILVPPNIWGIHIPMDKDQTWTEL